MPALDFPTNPTNGQQYGNWVYSTSKGAWQAKPLTSAVATPSDTAPLNPDNGDLWYNTNDGNTYVYYVDGTSNQWVQLKSDATLSSTLGTRVTTLEASPSALIPISPTSVTVASGTGSVTALGTVTYSGVSSVSLNGIFTSAYPHYRIIVQHELTANTGINLRLRASGTDNSSSVYNNTHAYWGTAGNGANIINNSTLFGGLFGHAIQRGAYEVYNPQLPSRTGMTFFGMAENTTAQTEQHTSSAMFKANNQFDGFSLFPTSGTMSGVLEVYGYR